MTNPKLRMLLEGLAKSGKSWLCATAPPPVLCFDWEQRYQYTIPGKQAVYWDGGSDPMQLAKSPTRTYIMQVTDLNKYAQAMQWLRSLKHPFRTVLFESPMEARSKLIFTKFPNVEAMEGKDVGNINRLVEAMVKDIINLTKIPKSPVDVVIATEGVVGDDYTKKLVPLGLGTVGKQIVHWFDVVAYLDNKGGRRLWLGQRADDDLLVGDGTNDLIMKYGPTILNPNISEMYKVLEEAHGQSAQPVVAVAEGDA